MGTLENTDENKIFFYSFTTSILAKLNTWCFKHSSNTRCSLLVNPNHTDESWARRNTCIWIIYVYIYVIMKTMCPPGYHHNGFVATHALGYMSAHHLPKCMSCHKATAETTGREHCFHDCIYITLILLLWDLSTLCWHIILVYHQKRITKKVGRKR